MNWLKGGVIAASCLGIAAAVSACGISSAASGVCPKIGVLPDASDLPVRDATGQVVALARLSVSNSACIYDTSKRPTTGIGRVSFTLDVRVAGAATQANRASRIKATYIIATIAPDGVVTGRKSYTTNVDITDGSGKEDDKVAITIPFEGSDASGHRVVAAFNLSEKDVQFNRERAGRF